MKILKFKLEITDEQAVKMPIQSKILTAQFQGDNLCIWAVCDLSLPQRYRYFAVVGTGNPFYHKKNTYIATVQNELFVWHVFEIDKSKTT